VDRRECQDRIELAIENLPPGVTASKVVLAGAEDSGQLIVAAEAGTEPTERRLTITATSPNGRDRVALHLKVVPAVAARERPQPLDCTADSGVSAVAVRRSQEEWAAYLQRKVEETVALADGVSMTFVLIPPGRFRVGSPPDEEGRDAEESLHVVVLPGAIDLGKYEVTQAQYEALMGKNPSRFKGRDLPVEQVSWHDACEFAGRLTERGGGFSYRLPTEAEWEYGCRGGLGSVFPFGLGAGRSLSSHQANFDGEFPAGGALKGPSLEAPCPVGSYPANAMGLHDMHGNVWEWCADRYGPYPSGEEVDPTGPAGGSDRVNRGGGWQSHAQFCRSARRRGDEPGARNFMLGFRLARTITDAKR
jgi:formylglycine-generating enzyme required for sulfatase activity